MILEKESTGTTTLYPNKVLTRTAASDILSGNLLIPNCASLLEMQAVQEWFRSVNTRFNQYTQRVSRVKPDPSVPGGPDGAVITVACNRTSDRLNFGMSCSRVGGVVSDRYHAVDYDHDQMLDDIVHTKAPMLLPQYQCMKSFIHFMIARTDVFHSKIDVSHRHSFSSNCDILELELHMSIRTGSGRLMLAGITTTSDSAVYPITYSKRIF